jgi:RecA/RadA recombinase/intein/homing endonuclease
MPKMKQSTRAVDIGELRARHSVESRKRVAVGDKKFDVLRATLTKKYKGEVFTTIANGTRAEGISALKTGWQGLDDLITGETDAECRTVAGTGLGWPRGRIIEVYGDEGMGKTTLTLHIIAAFQRAGERCAFIDAEHSLDVSYARKLGVDLTSLVFNQPDRGGEQALDLVTSLADSGVFGCIVVDSVAALTPLAELELDFEDNSQPGGHARLMSRALRKLTTVVARHSTLLVFINQTRCIASHELVVTERGIEQAADTVEARRVAGVLGQLTAIGGRASSWRRGRRVVCEDGRSLTAGLSHPVRIMGDGAWLWKPTADLRVGDWVAVSRTIELPEVNDGKLPSVEKSGHEKFEPLPDTATEAFCMFLGMWFSDGSLIDTEQCINFTEVSVERREALLSQLKSLGWGNRTYGKHGVGLRSQVYKLLDAIGCERGAKNKTIPSVITGRRQWRAFLRGMFDSHVTNHGFNMTFENYNAARKTQLALLGFGINSRLSDTRTIQLYVSGRDAGMYVELIGFSENSKRDAVIAAAAHADASARGKADVIPNPGVFIGQARAARGWVNVDADVKQRIAAVLHGGHALALRDYIIVANTCGLKDELAKHRWVKISSIEDVGCQPMVDFDVPGGRAFIAGGLVTHNCKIGVRFGNPKTTTGGQALKFYASVRLEMVNVNTKKKGDRVIWRRTRIRTVKNKVAAPFREVFADIVPGKGITVVHGEPDLDGGANDE